MAHKVMKQYRQRAALMPLAAAVSFQPPATRACNTDEFSTISRPFAHLSLLSEDEGVEGSVKASSCRKYAVIVHGTSALYRSSRKNLA